MRTLLLLLLTLVSLSADEAKPKPEEEWAFLDNGTIRLGVKRDWGAGIGWFSESGSERNLVNHWDHGRLIQQSYYGKEDGSLWNDKPWRWNPVQGGDWKGHPAKVLELKVDADKHTLYAKSVGKHWAAGEDLKDVTFEEWIILEGPVAKIRFRFTYSGETTHPESHHEIPAVFLAPDLDTLVVYDGDQPWTGGPVSRSIPGWPNESRTMTENWAAYVEPGRDYGMGAYVPIADSLTCYRFGDGKAEHGSCSYFAPLAKFAVTPGKIFAYDLYLTLGSVDEMRRRFAEIHKAAKP